MRKPMLWTISLTLLATAVGAGERVGTYRGENSGSTPAFEVEAPWLLDWTITSESPAMAEAEIRLIDAETGRFVGEIAELTGTGSGLKVMGEGGRLRIRVTGAAVAWLFLIEQSDAATAAELLAAAGDDRPAPAINRLLQDDLDQFSGWTAEDARTLILHGRDGPGVRVTLRADCPGLTTARNVSFVTRLVPNNLSYDSILLEDGTRCYFADVQPWVE